MDRNADSYLDTTAGKKRSPEKMIVGLVENTMDDDLFRHDLVFVPI